jgi:hypothetical protein
VLWVSAILASAIPGVLIVGYLNRRGSSNGEAKGIGWQFIRYTVLTIAIPVVGILALNDALTGEAATLIAGAMGYAIIAITGIAHKGNRYARQSGRGSRPALLLIIPLP